MKKKYQNFHFENFVEDDYFRKWIFEGNKEDQLFWENYQIENPNQQNDILLAKAFLEKLKGIDNDLSDGELDEVTQTIIDKSKHGQMTVSRGFIYRIAAAIIIFLGLSFAIYYFSSKVENTDSVSQNNIDSVNKLIETTNSSDKIQDIQLSDGSTIQLYPKSSVRYPNPFEATKRVVYLDGKAFFDVAKNPDKPFWVHTNKLSTQVLGTSFLVNAYDNQKTAKVEVKTGKVSVYLQKDLKTIRENENTHLTGIVLTPNQQASLSDKDNHLIKTIVETPELITTPKKSEFDFEDVALKDVLNTLSKSYGISFTYNEKTIENCFLTANLETHSLYEKLNLICRITHSSYEVVDAQIIIHSKGCN
jgi:transmembrane sensor